MIETLKAFVSAFVETRVRNAIHKVIYKLRANCFQFPDLEVFKLENLLLMAEIFFSVLIIIFVVTVYEAHFILCNLVRKNTIENI